MSALGSYCDWIAVDWGTTHLRAWAMSGHKVVAEERSGKGMNSLQRHDFEPTLLELVAPWLGQEKMPVVACGMVGSRQGWAEAPYRSVPCPPIGQAGVRVPTNNASLMVTLVPGLRQDQPADVMRGEETQIAGFLARNPAFDGVICLPGTHSKWAHVSAGEVVSFRTFMTGELFDLAANASILRHAVGDGWDGDAFRDAVDDTLSRPETLAARLFSIRADTLLSGLQPAAARSRLSGTLIGAELAAARPYWLGQSVVLIGADEPVRAYADALDLQGIKAMCVDAGEMTRAGLYRALFSIQENVA